MEKKKLLDLALKKNAPTHNKVTVSSKISLLGLTVPVCPKLLDCMLLTLHYNLVCVNTGCYDPNHQIPNKATGLLRAAFFSAVGMGQLLLSPKAYCSSSYASNIITQVFTFILLMAPQFLHKVLSAAVLLFFKELI
jgi:hypothetical protein